MSQPNEVYNFGTYSSQSSASGSYNNSHSSQLSSFINFQTQPDGFRSLLDMILPQQSSGAPHQLTRSMNGKSFHFVNGVNSSMFKPSTLNLSKNNRNKTRPADRIGEKQKRKPPLKTPRKHEKHILVTGSRKMFDQTLDAHQLTGKWTSMSKAVKTLILCHD